MNKLVIARFRYRICITSGATHGWENGVFAVVVIEYLLRL